MADTIFRTRQSETQTKESKEEPHKPVDESGVQDIKIEPPYTDYEKVHNHPFLVDYYKIGDTWRDKLGGFEKEIESIDGYFRNKIQQGQLKNEKESVESEIKKIYKLCGIEKTERTTMQIEKLAAYIDFLRKTDDITMNHFKYV